MTKIFYHKDLTDEQWNKIKFLFESERKVGRPAMNPRNAFNGILWILKSGARHAMEIGIAFTINSGIELNEVYLKNFFKPCATKLIYSDSLR